MPDDFLFELLKVKKLEYELIVNFLINQVKNYCSFALYIFAGLFILFSAFFYSFNPLILLLVPPYFIVLGCILFTYLLFIQGNVNQMRLCEKDINNILDKIKKQDRIEKFKKTKIASHYLDWIANYGGFSTGKYDKECNQKAIDFYSFIFFSVIIFIVFVSMLFVLNYEIPNKIFNSEIPNLLIQNQILIKITYFFLNVGVGIYSVLLYRKFKSKHKKTLQDELKKEMVL